MLVAGFDAEFVVAAPQVLNERVPADYRRRGPVGSSTAHWPESCLESSVIALDPVVPILSGVMEHFWEQVIDNAQQRRGQVSGDLPWPVPSRQHCLEEPGRSRYVAPLRHPHVDDLAMLVDRSIHVPSHSGNLHVGFIDEPSITNTAPGRPSRVDDQRGEALHPPINRHVINVDTAFREQFFDIAVGQAVAEIPAHRQQDHLRREPVAGERNRNRAATTDHPCTHRPTLNPPTQQCRCGCRSKNRAPVPHRRTRCHCPCSMASYCHLMQDRSFTSRSRSSLSRACHSLQAHLKQDGKQMSRTTVRRTRSLRTIAAPLIAIVLVMTSCGSDGPVEDPSIPNTLRGGKGTEW
jgi:hypothetical protein